MVKSQVVPPAEVNKDAAQVSEVTDTTDWKAESRKWEQRAKDHKASVESIKQKVSDAEKTAEERMEARVSEVEKRAQKAEFDALRSRIQARFKVSDDDAELFLTGADERTLKKQAEALEKRSADTIRKGNYVPREGTNNGEGAVDDMRVFASKMFKRS